MQLFEAYATILFMAETTPGTSDENYNDLIPGMQATPVANTQRFDLHNKNALPYAAAEYLGVPRADITDMLARSNNSPLVSRALESLTIVAQAQSQGPNGLFLSFRRISGELRRASYETRDEQDDVHFTLLGDTSVPKPDYEGQDPAWTGAVVASRTHEDGHDEFLFALVGNDPTEHNVLSADNAAIIFDDAYMTPERKLRAMKTIARIDQQQGGHFKETEPASLVSAFTEEIGQNIFFGQQVEPKIYT
jgi:hypothetical protein